MTVDVERVLLKARSLYESGQLQDAIRLLSDAISATQDQPNSLPTLLVPLANLIRRDPTSRTDDVLSHLQQAKSILDTQMGSDVSQNERGMMHASLGVAFQEAQDWVEARGQYEKAIRLLDDHHPSRVRALHSLTNRVRQEEPGEALKCARMLLTAVSGLPSGSFMFATQRLAAAQLYTELELAHGGTPDAAHLHDAIELIRREFPTFRIPPEIDHLLRDIASGPTSAPRLTPADPEGPKEDPA